MALRWQELAACRGMNPDLFFPEQYANEHGHIKQVCAVCPVAAECLEYAIVNEERFGWWGGIGPRDLRRLQRMRGEASGQPSSRKGKGRREPDLPDADLGWLLERRAASY